MALSREDFASVPSVNASGSGSPSSSQSSAAKPADLGQGLFGGGVLSRDEYNEQVELAKKHGISGSDLFAYLSNDRSLHEDAQNNLWLYTRQSIEDRKLRSGSDQAGQHSNPLLERPDPNFGERAGRTVLGAVEGSVGDTVGAFANFYEGGVRGAGAQRERELADLRQQQERAMKAVQASLEKYNGDMDNVNVQAAQRTLKDVEDQIKIYEGIDDSSLYDFANDVYYKAADTIKDKSQQNIDRAKQGLGAGGQFAVDLGVAATQMGLDALTMKGLGMGGVRGAKAAGGLFKYMRGATNVLPAMAVHSFGSGALQARAAGASYERQALFGLATAMNEVMTEKISDMPKLAGGGITDKIVNRALSKFVDSPVARTAVRVAVGFGYEAFEEFIAGIVEPALESIYNDKSIRENYSDMEISDILYDALVGGTLGLIGTGRAAVNGSFAADDARIRIQNEAQANIAKQLPTEKSSSTRSKAEAIAKVLSGEELTPAEQKQLDRSPVAQSVLAEMQTQGVDNANPLYNTQAKRQNEREKKATDKLFSEMTPEQVAGYSESDLAKLRNIAQKNGNQKAVDMLNGIIDQGKAEAAAQNQAGESEEGPSFGKRLVDEASEKEPELQGSLKVLFELDNETFERNLRWFDKNEKVLRDMYEWALWNEEFDKADIIKNMAKASGFDLNKTTSEATEEKAPPPGDEEAPPPPADNDVSSASSEESEQTQRGGIDLTPSEGSQRRANALDEETRDGLKAKLADLQQKLKDNPELAKDENFVKQVSDVFNEINSALDSVSESETEPKNSTAPTESGTIEPESKPKNPLTETAKEANNGGKQTVREPETGTAGVQSTSAAEGRREGAVAEPQAERPVESAENRGGSEASGQAAEDVPRAERGGRKNEKSSRKAKPKWLTSEQDSSDFDKWQSGGKSTGKRAPAPMGKDVLDLKKDGGTGVIQTLPGTQIIEAPDVGTVAHMVFKILDAFNVKSHQRHVYSTKYFANFGSDGQPGVIKGVNNGGQVAVAVDEAADIPVQQNAIKTAIHECTHRNFGKKFGTNGSRAKISSVDTSKAITVDSVTVEQRSEYTYKKLIECFVKAGFSESGAKAGISEIAEFWLNEADENGDGGFGYATQYDVDGTRKQYADSVSGLNLGSESLESAVRAALQKRVSEEMLVDLTCNSPKIAALVREGVISYEDSLRLKDAALNALAADGVLQQKEVDAINVAFEAMQNFEFVEASLSSTGSSDANISQSSEPQRSSYTPAVRFVEKDFNANRSKKAQPNPNEGKSPPKKVKTVEHDSVASAAKAISGIKTVFEGGAEGFPDVIAIDRNGRTYTIPENVKSAVKQVKNAVRGIGEGKHPMRSLGKLIQLYDNFATPGSDMARFTTDEINQAIADIKEIGNSKTLSDNQKIMRLETATTRALNLIGAQMRNVNEAFEMDFEIAKLIAGDGKSAVRNKLARGFLAKTASGVNEAYSVWKSLQLNPTTMFKMIGKFDKASGNAGYQIANKIERATAVSQMNYAIAMQEFNELRNMKGFNEFATNKTKCSVKLGDIELTEQEAVDFIKRVNTLKATVIGGKSRLSTIKGFTIKGSDGKYVYIDSKAVKSKWADIASSMEKSLSPVAKAYMDAASKALYDLGGKVSEMKRNTTGVGFWTMEKGVYYPLQYHSPSHEDVSLDSEITNFFGPTGASVTLQRTRDEGGYVVIQPSALTVDNYINRASSYTGFGQLATQLGIMDAPGAGLNGLSNMVANNFGKQYGKVVRNYVNDMNNVMRAESGFNKLARKLRMNLQKGALMTSVSVPIKQVASYWNAIGVLSPEAVTKAYRFKMLKAKGSGAENMLLAYRAVGGIDPTVSEVLNNKDFLRGLKKKAKIIDTFDKAISIMDYRTVDNLYAATVLDVKATFPDVDVNSEEFARLVNAKFEEVVINTQPIYTALARSESQRTNNEIIRNLSTFRTQQTQNFNRLITTIGEAKAAKGTVGELLADKALKQTITGQIAAQVEFGLLGVLADLVLHRWKKYRRDDDEDKFDVGKFAERWFINTVESAAGTAWLGDQAAKWAIDRIAKAVNDDTDIHEFYGVSVGALSTLKQTYDSFGYLMDKPSVYNVKRFVVNLSTICGMPIGNLYNNANALIMWGASILGENPDKYDDVIKYVFGEETKKDKENRKADKLYQAVADGNTEKANKLFEYYGSKADANEQIAGAIMRRYQAGKLGKEAAVNELREYADMSKYDAEHYINEATAKLELGYEYSKIKDKYQSGEITRQEALSYRQKYGSESAKDAEAEVQKWTMEVDTGYDYSDLEKHFAAGDVTKEDAIRYRIKYGGEDRKDAEKTVAHWQCEVDTDIPYSEITDYYVSGEISKSKLVSYYQKYGLYDAEKAQEKADVAQFIWDKKDQLGDATAAAVRGYNNYCGDLGIDKEFYLSNYFAINKVEGVKNSKGKTISGSVVTNKIKYIDNLNLTPAQKTAIANACNIELKSLKKYHAPWL